MNEKAVFFFSSDEKKKYSFEIEWMNGMWTFTGKKKHKKNTKKCGKKNTPHFKKKIKKNPPDPEWMPHELFLGKKYTLVFFFPLRYIILQFDWMNSPWTLSGKKKYDTFACLKR